MTMEIDKSHQDSNMRSHAIAMTDEQQLAQNVGNKKEGDKDENDGDSDSGSMTCPLFMEGLPRNFASNAQLAAIASLLDDEVREETKENKAENDSTPEDKNTSTLSCDQSPQTTISRHSKISGKARKNRRRQRASPYPRPQDRTNDKATKKASVGEITLFMNMWKP
mmetsp:Transcript_9890/g.24656  ORF Transcript_9890/g.24656 Transcript_9890/m.24656 type:complete len:166 (-) Transcript_9890:365-862(-)